MKTRIGILGYGNLGKGVELAVSKTSDMELCAVFTRRDPASLTVASGVPVVSVNDIDAWTDQIDVLILCGGSATDLPKQTPVYASKFNVIDSFDTHADIPAHFDRVNEAALQSGHLAMISVGWDPGLFSLMRALTNAVLPDGKDYTFWGKGVSQGHSDAVRRIQGVKNAKQYTIPVEAALSAVRNGENPELSTREKHTREVFVVPEDGADLNAIEKEIKEMPKYFSDYDTTVHFIDEETFHANHLGMAHGGFVFRSGVTGKNDEHRHVIEFSLKLDSNPEFTSSVLVACARAVKRLYDRGERGCRTIFDIAPADLLDMDRSEMRAHLL